MALLSLYLADLPDPDHTARLFWSKVDKTEGCWLWRACRANGYGRFSLCLQGRYRSMLAHRVAYLLTFGQMPPTPICHHCDNPACVRPDHLFVGTQADNVRDMWDKGRNRGGTNPRYGSRHPEAKLTEEQVSAMRAAFAAGERREALAARFGVSVHTVGYVVYRLGWRHVP